MADLRSLLGRLNQARFAQYVIVALAAVAAAAIVSRFSIFNAIEDFTQDVRIANLTSPAAQHRRIVIVAFTEQTLDTFAYRSPINRRFLAALIDKVAMQGPVVIGVDVLLDRATDGASDQRLRAAIARHRNLVVLASPANDGGDLPEDRRAVWRSFKDSATSGDGSLSLSRRDRTVRAHVPANGAGAPQTFAALIAARAGARIPSGQMIIPFHPALSRAAAWPFITYDARDAMQVPPSLGWFAGKIVLIGGVLATEDQVATPARLAPGAAETMPGLIVHAHQLAQILDGDAPRPAPVWLAFVLMGVCAATGVWAGAALLDWRLLSLAFFGATLFYAVAAFAAYSSFAFLAPIGAPILSLIFALGGGAALSASQNARSRRAIDQAFRHYVAPEVVDEIMRRPERFKIDGDAREISVVITDIEGFTAMLDQATSSALGAPINQYFDALIDAVITHGGAVDKIVGDGLVALFGAPVRRVDHAARAVACARDIDMIAERFRAGSAPLAFGRTRIGVSTGIALVGSFGGGRRINYTAYGSMVNLADRLQAANRVLGTRALISEASFKQGGVVARPVGKLALRGIAQSQLAFEPCPDGAVLEAYWAAYKALEARAPEAAGLFAALQETAPSDPLVAFHAARLNAGAVGADLDLRAR